MMMRRIHLLALAVALLFSKCAFSQATAGTPPFGSFGGGPFDVINLGNLNVHFNIAVRHKPGRVTEFAYDIGYDSSVWYPVTSGGTTAWTPLNAYGWNIPSPSGSITDQLVQTVTNQPCDPTHGNYTPITYHVYAFFVYHDTAGGTHPINISTSDYQPNSGCPAVNPPWNETGTATDGSGYVLTAAGIGSLTVTGPDGKILVSPTSSNTVTDANGNQISMDGSGNISDTLGTTALTVTGTFPKLLKYTAPSGALATWTVNYTSYNIKTNFGCSGVAEYSANGVQLPTSISLPDGSSYSFAYEDTQGFSGYKTGRLTSVTLPTGGSISYSYPFTNSGTKNGITCADGSAPIAAGTSASMTRTVSPGGTWNYFRTQVAGNHWQTKVTTPPDPTVGNDTVIDFQQDSTTGYGATHNFFETQRKTYQGSSTGGTLLATAITCYNTASPTPATCPTTAVSTLISRVTAFSYLPDTSGKVSEIDTQYSFLSDPSFPTEIDSYDYGALGSVGLLVRKVINAYTIFGNTVRLNSTAVEDSSNNIKATTGYSYDQTTATATSGTPQHTSPPSNRANLTMVSTQVSGTVTLYRRFTYYDTGMLNTASDLGTTISGGSNLTTYNYGSGTSCGNSFPTSLSEPLSLSRSFTWDCNGGAMTSTTDESGNTSSVYYTGTNFGKSADPNFWRPYATADQLGNGTTWTYPNSTTSESALLFNGNNSVVDTRTKVDNFGRPLLSQFREGPSSSSYDITLNGYDSLGRFWYTTLPYVGTVDQVNGSAPSVNNNYDALGRLTSKSYVPGGGGNTYSYTNNDTLQTTFPAPNGENTKRRQLEYDGLGRLSSVCELTSVTGSGSCGQTVTQTGFWTKYGYDLLGNITGVTQNAQAAGTSQQTRTYTFDMAGRLTSELNPETGSSAITYTYDTSDANCSSYSSPGDLVEKKDAMGNYTCFKYDALHRNIQIVYPSGTYAAVTPTKCYVYDSATVNSVVMGNTKGRLAEAYTTTATSCPGTATVDEGFSYTKRGEVADVYEKTPNSGGWYHVNASYWAHGRLNVLNGGTNPLPGLPAITYGASDGSGIDGKGRITKVNAASGQNPVNSIGWNAGNQITGVTFGSLDNDSYSYDPNTGRMMQYQFNMGTAPQSQTGVLTWNANGTLGQLQITDQINSANSQTCTYSHDDLSRITSANCGSVWSQTFGFDPFGNLSKTGSAQFLPTYTGVAGAGSPTNQYYQISGGASGTTNYYDANGNLKNDVTHSYTWDADGNMLSTDGSTVGMIYDAMDRMIEQTRGSSHTQIVYGPYGMKLALMNGQTLVNAFVKLPGGSRAVYGASGLAYYRHSDHLGSSRLATTPSRTKYYDVAYAPYGEDYNGSGTTPDLAFTDENQDTVKNGWSSNLYDFMLREYRTAHGRWTSPDPTGLAAVDPTNPQTWDRYAYVINNPMAYIDLLGDDYCSGYDDNNEPTNAAWCEEAGGTWHTVDPNPGHDCSMPGSCNTPPPAKGGCPAGQTCGGGGQGGANTSPSKLKPATKPKKGTLFNPTSDECAQIQSDTERWATTSLALGGAARWAIGSIWGIPTAGWFAAGAIATGAGTIPGAVYSFTFCGGLG